MSLCSECRLEVSAANSAAVLDRRVYPAERDRGVFDEDKHVFPEGKCPGSPSRANLLREAQPGITSVAGLSNDGLTAVREIISRRAQQKAARRQVVFI